MATLLKLQALKLCTASRLSHLQVLAFSRTIHEDLSNYDTCGAWPTLIDSYVGDVRCRAAPARARAAAALLSDASPTALTHAGIVPLSVPATSGRKRLHPDDEAQADELAERLSGSRLSGREQDGAQPLRRRRRVFVKDVRAPWADAPGSPHVPFGGVPGASHVC
jgi:hypothetical protein